MKNTAQKLKGVPVWKCTPSALRNYCEDNNIPLKEGLKQFEIAKIVKTHLASNGTEESISPDTLPAETPKAPTEKKKSSGKKSPTVKKEKNKDFVLEKPATETEKKIVEADCKTTIKMWKLSQLGRTTNEIAEILKKLKPQHIEYFVGSYKKTEKLQKRADAVEIK